MNTKEIICLLTFSLFVLCQLLSPLESETSLCYHCWEKCMKSSFRRKVSREIDLFWIEALLQVLTLMRALTYELMSQFGSERWVITPVLSLSYANSKVCSHCKNRYIIFSSSFCSHSSRWWNLKKNSQRIITFSWKYSLNLLAIIKRKYFCFSKLNFRFPIRFDQKHQLRQFSCFLSVHKARIQLVDDESEENLNS